jgi:hypothetical protein
MTALATRYLSVDEAVEEAFRLAIEGTPTPEAAAEIYNRGIRPDEVSTLVIRGLIASVHARLALHRGSWAEDGRTAESDGAGGPQSTARGRLSALSPHYARDHWARVLGVKNYEGADGQRKSLLEFTAADITALMGIANARATGYAKLAEAMTLASQLLATHKADTIAGLPVKAKQMIAEAVA